MVAKQVVGMLSCTQVQPKLVVNRPGSGRSGRICERPNQTLNTEHVAGSEKGFWKSDYLEKPTRYYVWNTLTKSNSTTAKLIPGSIPRYNGPYPPVAFDRHDLYFQPFPFLFPCSCYDLWLSQISALVLMAFLPTSFGVLNVFMRSQKASRVCRLEDCM